MSPTAVERIQGALSLIPTLAEELTRAWEERYANYRAEIHAGIDCLIAELQCDLGDAVPYHNLVLQWRRRGLS